MLTANDLLNHKITRTLPHVIDTILLGAAIFLTILIQHYPGQSHWLSVKVIALLFYIGFGTIASSTHPRLVDLCLHRFCCCIPPSGRYICSSLLGGYPRIEA